MCLTVALTPAQDPRPAGQPPGVEELAPDGFRLGFEMRLVDLRLVLRLIGRWLSVQIWN